MRDDLVRGAVRDVRRPESRPNLHAADAARQSVHVAGQVATGRLIMPKENNHKREIAWEIYDAMTALGADQGLLGAIAGWAEGEDDEAVLSQLRSHNQTGSIYRKVIGRSPDS
jgi:hypothetical protein